MNIKIIGFLICLGISNSYDIVKTSQDINPKVKDAIASKNEKTAAAGELVITTEPMKNTVIEQQEILDNNENEKVSLDTEVTTTPQINQIEEEIKTTTTTPETEIPLLEQDSAGVLTDTTPETKENLTAEPTTNYERVLAGTEEIPLEIIDLTAQSVTQQASDPKETTEHDNLELQKKIAITAQTLSDLENRLRVVEEEISFSPTLSNVSSPEEDLKTLAQSNEADEYIGDLKDELKDPKEIRKEVINELTRKIESISDNTTFEELLDIFQEILSLKRMIR